MARLLLEESKLMEIVKLIGEDVLPEDQKLVIECAKVVRVGFLQQDAYQPHRHLCACGKAVPHDGSDPLFVRQRQKGGRMQASPSRSW